MATSIRSVLSPDAPAPVGPYSQAIVAGDLVFAAGQIPLDPATGKLIEGDIAAQAERVLQNIRAVLAEAGTSLAKVVKTTVFLVDLADFPRMNEVYARHFASDPETGALDGPGREAAGGRRDRDRGRRLRGLPLTLAGEPVHASQAASRDSLRRFTALIATWATIGATRLPVAA